ncbi:hypothetical protein OJ593_10045, partial [Streptococcus anginosus]|nr:hypothetical protein [Streptococcus anginosus]
MPVIPNPLNMLANITLGTARYFLGADHRFASGSRTGEDSVAQADGAYPARGKIIEPGTVGILVSGIARAQA